MSKCKNIKMKELSIIDFRKLKRAKNKVKESFDKKLNN